VDVQNDAGHTATPPNAITTTTTSTSTTSPTTTPNKNTALPETDTPLSQDLYTDLPPSSANPFDAPVSTLDAGYEPSLNDDDDDDDDDDEEDMIDDLDEAEDHNLTPSEVIRRVQRKKRSTRNSSADSPATTGKDTPTSAPKRTSISKRFKAEVSASNILPSTTGRRSKKRVDYNRVHYEFSEETTPKRRSSRRGRSTRQTELIVPSILPRRSRKTVNYQEKDETDLDFEADMSDEEHSASDVEFVDVSPPKKAVRKSRKKTISVESDEEDNFEDEEVEEEEEYEALVIDENFDEGDVIDTVEIILAVRSAKSEEPAEEKDAEDGTEANEEDEEENYQYFVKFQDKAYRWATWVGRDQIEEQRNGTTKLERFHRKHGYPEDFENLDGVFFNPSYSDVDRIIGESIYPSGKRIFFVKWKALGYDQCTWEFEDTLKEDQWAIDEFRKRDKAPRVSDMRVPPRPPPNEFQKISNESMQFKDGNELRSYQIEGVNWMIFSWFNRVNGILADEMGLGKTIQTVSMIYYLFKQQHNRGPFLIVAPLSTIEHWKREVEEWTDMNCVVFHGNKLSRKNIMDHEFYFKNRNNRIIRDVFKFNVLITTYEMCLQEKSTLSRINWQYLAVDEGHRLKNKSSKLLDVLQHFSVEHKLLLTGTPIQNDIGELFTLLNYLNPLRFPSRNNFDEKYGNLQNKEQVEELHNLIKPYLLRRMKEDVEKSIPPKEEIVVEVVPTTYQKTYYKAILEGKREFLRQGVKKKSQMPRLVNILMEIRKVCNHPFLISGAESQITRGMTPTQINETLVRASSKLIFTDKLLKHLKENGHKVLIFSQMVRVLHILEDFLNYRQYNYVRLDGSIKGDVRQEAIDRFNDPSKDVFAFLISTRAGGVGINLMAADTVIIFDSDFNPQNDIQAQARCHRIGQKKEVKVYRLLTKDTKEFELFQRANRKLGLDRAVLSNISSVDFSGKKAHSSIGLDKDEIDVLLKHGAYVAYKDDSEEEKMLLEGDIDDILKRSSKVIRWDQETAKKEKGGVSHFSKASFNFEDKVLDIDDKDFWSKVLPQAKDVHGLSVLFSTDGSLSSEEDRTQFFRDLEPLVDGAIEQIGKFEVSPDHEALATLLVRVMYSNKVNPEQRDLARDWLEKVDKRKARYQARQLDAEELETMEDDEDIEAFVIPAATTHGKKGGWYKSERDTLLRGLNNLGWGKWEVLKGRKEIHKTSYEVRSLSEAITQMLIDACRQQGDLDRKEEKEATSETPQGQKDEKVFKRRDYNMDIALLHSLLKSSCVEADMLDESSKQSLTCKVKRSDGNSTITPGKGVFVLFPQDKKLKESPCRIEIIEQASTEEEDELTPSKNMCVRMIELVDEDFNSETFKVAAPGYHCKFTVRLISPEFTGESEVYTVRGAHPVCEEADFKAKVYRNHKSTIKKLRANNNLTKLLTHLQHKPKQTDIPDLTLKTPAPWWDKECDVDLLVGIASHGNGKFQDLKIDQTLCFQKKLKDYANSLKTKRDKDKAEKSFPSTTHLSKRLERLVDTMLKNADLLESHDSAGTLTMSREWGKSERERFKKDMNLFGGHPNKDGELNYGKLIVSARLTKSPQYLKVYAQAFLKMCARVAETELKDDEKPKKETDEFKSIEKDVEDLTQKSAKKILERVRLMRGLAMYVFEEAEENVTKFNRHTKKKGSGLPLWWKVNTHDVELIKGVQKYGVDARAIMNDKDYSFSKLTEEQTKKVRDALIVKRLDDFSKFMEKLHKCGSPKKSKTLWDFTPKKQHTVLDKSPHVKTPKDQDGSKGPKNNKQSTLPFGNKKRKRISLDTVNSSSQEDRAKIKRKKPDEGSAATENETVTSTTSVQSATTTTTTTAPQ